MTLIAEDLLLLLLDDDSGKAQTSQLETALGGAVLVELALAEAVTVSTETKPNLFRQAKVWAEPEVEVDDVILRDAVRTIGEKERTAQDLVFRLGKGLTDTLCERLAERGVLERREDKLFGLIPRTRWPARDSSHEEDLRRTLTDVLVAGVQPDERTGALVALLYAVDRAHKTVPHDGLSNAEVRKRAKQVAEGQWAAVAVKNAIAAVTAATTAAVVAATSAAAMGSGT
ncbi:MAG: GPP34 family phosphoprotein [Nocardioides sp.]